MNILGRKKITLDTDEKEYNDICEVSKILVPLMRKYETCSKAVIVSSICGLIETVAQFNGFNKLDLLTEVNETMLNTIYRKD